MADIELRCNIVQCRQALANSGRACVTTCSHIFCLQCASASFNKALVCPACDTTLSAADDIVFTDLNPTEDYKSSVLAGLRPEVVMDIAARAISFFAYQTQQEACFQEMIYKSLDEKCTNYERQYETVVREANQEISIVRDKFSTLQKESEQERKKNAELLESYNEKSRQLQKLQVIYDKLKRKSMLQNSNSQQQKALDQHHLGSQSSQSALSIPLARFSPKSSHHQSSASSLGKHLNFGGSKQPLASPVPQSRNIFAPIHINQKESCSLSHQLQPPRSQFSTSRKGMAFQ